MMFETTHIHPMIVHFPIALIIAGFLADTLFLFYKQENWLHKMGFFLMVLGTLAAGASYLAGELFTSEPTEGEIVKFYQMHTTGAAITLSIMSLVSLLRVYFTFKEREDKFRWVIYVLYVLGTAAVSFTGFIGGTMVYSYMLGI
jgi:uncharacterized membrane protein